MDDQIRYVPATPLGFPLDCANSAEVAVLLALHFVLKFSPVPPTAVQMNRAAELHPRTFTRGLRSLVRRGAVVAVKLV